MELMHLSLLILRMGSLVSREVLCIRCLESQQFRLSLVRAFPLSPQPPQEANRPLRRRERECSPEDCKTYSRHPLRNKSSLQKDRYFERQESQGPISQVILLIISAIDHTRPHFLWVYRRDNPRRMLGEHEKSL